jgi:long-subunit fatty acid transport protein
LIFIPRVCVVGGFMRCRVALLLLAASAAPAAAGGFAIPEMGARRTGMGAVVGRPDEPAAVLHNPAGLTLLAGTRLYLSFGVSFLDTSFRLRPWPDSDRFLEQPVDGDGYYPETEPSRAFGVLPMLVASTEILPGRLWAAVALYVGNATGSAFDEDAPTRYHLIDGYVVAPLGSLSAAYRFDDLISLGAGLGLMNVRIHGRRHLFPVLDGTDVSGFLGTRAELVIDGSDWMPTWNLGALATPHPRVSIGAGVIGRTDAVLEGPVEINFGDDVGGGTFYGDQSTELLLPWTFLGGINVDVHDNLELGAELRYWLYRQYDQQRIDVERIIFVDEIVTEKNYRDSYQVSGGGRLHGLAAVPGLEGMLGWHYDRTPAPKETVSLDQPTFSHIGLHGGLRYQRGRYRLGLTYAHYWYQVPTITSSTTMPPSNITGSGENHIFTASFEAMLGPIF